MNIEETPNICDILKQMNTQFSNATICKLTDEQQKQYTILLNKLSLVNSNPLSSKQEKGRALEEIVSFILSNSGCIFKVYKNVRKNTNEIDQLVSLTPSGKYLLKNGIINSLYDNFICECKNYKNKVQVTFVGKFYSLMQTCKMRLGILFSYKGVSGNNWSEGTGLIKKIYMYDLSSDTNHIIVDFNINDFNAIKNGSNFLDIIENKLLSLQLDTDFSQYVKEHPAESLFKDTLLI